MQRNEFLTIMAGLTEMYNDKKDLSKPVLNIYYEIFKNYDIKLFSKAVSEVIKIHKFSVMPTPAEILSFLENNPEEKSLIAWNKVLEAKYKVGYYDSVVFDDKLIHNCIKDLGGWMWFCEQYEKNLPFIEKRFRELYNVYLKRGSKNNIERLIGFIEADNTKKGFINNVPEPIKIGFKKVKQIVE